MFIDEDGNASEEQIFLKVSGEVQGLINSLGPDSEEALVESVCMKLACLDSFFSQMAITFFYYKQLKIFREDPRQRNELKNYNGKFKGHSNVLSSSLLKGHLGIDFSKF